MRNKSTSARRLENGTLALVWGGAIGGDFYLWDMEKKESLVQFPHHVDTNIITVAV